MQISDEMLRVAVEADSKAFYAGAGKEACMRRAIEAALSLPVQPRTTPDGKWEIDQSTPNPILTYEKCSVIQDEQAFYVLRLIEADRVASPPVPPTKGPEDDLISAAQAFVDKLELCHADPEYQSVWMTSHIHRGPYAGPQYTVELDKLKSALIALRSRPASALPVVGEAAETIETYFARQIEWSRNTFGPALRTGGVIDHIRKELGEIEADPHDLSEWIDVVILAMDGFWRHGGAASDLLPRLLAKQQKNMARAWPDWRKMSEDQAIEHDRSGEVPSVQP